MAKATKVLLMIAFIGSMILMPTVLAVENPFETGTATGTFELNNPLRSDNVYGLLDSILGFLRNIAGAILVIMILYAAFQYMVSGGKPEKVKAATQTIMWSAIGFVVVLISGGVGKLIASLLGVQSVDGITDGPITDESGVIGLLYTVSRWMFGILMSLGSIAILYGAYQFMFTLGDTDKISKARRIIVYAIVALSIGILAGGAALLIQNIIGASEGSILVPSRPAGGLNTVR